MLELKQTTFSGHAENNVIILDDQIKLPDGIKVTVTLTKPAPQKASSGLCGIWQDDRPVEEIIRDITGSRSIGRSIPTL